MKLAPRSDAHQDAAAGRPVACAIADAYSATCRRYCSSPARRDLAIGLVVDHRPAGRLPRTRDRRRPRAACRRQREGDRRFAAAGAARLGGGARTSRSCASRRRTAAAAAARRRPRAEHARLRPRRDPRSSAGSRRTARARAPRARATERRAAASATRSRGPSRRTIRYESWTSAGGSDDSRSVAGDGPLAHGFDAHRRHAPARARVGRASCQRS